MFPVFNSSVPQPMQPQPQDPEDDDDDDPTIWTASKCKSVLQFHGNERTMNINPLILTNVQGSPYFKVELFGIKTFSEVPTCSPYHLPTCSPTHLPTCPPAYLPTCSHAHVLTCSPAHLSPCSPTHVLTRACCRQPK